METLGKRVRARRADLKLSQAELASRVGISQPSLSAIENDETQGTTKILKLAEVLECDPNWLLMGNKLKFSVPNKLTTYKNNPVANESVFTTINMGKRDLPIRGLAQGGDGVLTFDQDAIDYTFRPSNLVGIDEAFALYVTGDSMGEVLIPGTLLLVHPKQEPKIMDFVVIEKIDRSVIVKRLVRRSANSVTLREYDPPNDFVLSRSEIRMMLRVCGTAME